MQNAKLLIGIVVIILLTGGGLFLVRQLQTPSLQEQKQAVRNQFEIGKPAPNFVLKDFEGNQVSLSQFYGQKVVVLDFWAAWCPFCVEEMKDLEAAHKVYKDNLVMIGIHRTDSGESIQTGKKFADEQGVTYLLLQGTAEIYRASTRGLQAMPVAIFIDKNGVVQDIKLGPKTEEEIKEKAGKLI